MAGLRGEETRMKKMLALVALAALGTAVHAQNNCAVTGKWNVHGSIAGNDSDMGCVFAQNGADVSGSCSADQGELKIAGKTDGAKITWSYNSEYNGTALTVKYSGTCAGDKITGTVSVEQFGVDGDFTATRTK